MKNVGIVFVLGCFLFSCGENIKIEENSKFKQKYAVVYLDSLKNKVFQDGDVNAYERLIELYYDMPNKENMLFWSLIMANKFEYTPAFMDVYTILNESYGCYYDANNCLDTRTENMALEYLKNAAARGDNAAKEKLQNKLLASPSISK